jgi:hypothetical protein
VQEPNFLLDALIDEAGMSHDGLAARVNPRGERLGLTLLYDHASVRRWIRDRTIPRGRVPELICEVLSERVGRSLSLADIGMGQGAGRLPDETPLSQTMDHAAALWRRLPPFSNGRTLLTISMWLVVVAPRWTLPTCVISGLSETVMSGCTGKSAAFRCARG